jgi:hypothetical protein
VRTVSRKMLIFALAASLGAAVLLAVGVFARELGAREAREQIARALDLDNASKIHVKSINTVGSDSVVEVTVDAAFRLTNDKKDGWTVTEVRTGDRRWESLELIRTAIRKEKVIRTSAEMSNLANALESFRRERGSYVVASSGAGLLDSLCPQYIGTVMRLDAWSHEFKYEGSKSEYRLTSAGPDGKVGTPDDLIIENGKLVQGAVQ